MRYICEGHEYRYTEEPTEGQLLDNYGSHVATLELDLWRDEYLYAIDTETGDVMRSAHENEIENTKAARGRLLVEAYVAHTS